MGRTARRSGPTCQEGSGSLIDKFALRIAVGRCVVGIVDRFLGTAKTHDCRHPGDRSRLDIGLADEVAREMRSAALASSAFLEAA